MCIYTSITHFLRFRILVLGGNGDDDARHFEDHLVFYLYSLCLSICRQLYQLDPQGDDLKEVHRQQRLHLQAIMCLDLHLLLLEEMLK